MDKVGLQAVMGVLHRWVSRDGQSCRRGESGGGGGVSPGTEEGGGQSRLQRVPEMSPSP